VAAAGAPGAVVSELLTSAEAGIQSGAVVDGFGEGGGVDACGNIGFAPNRTGGFLLPAVLGGVGAAAHFVGFGISGVLGESSFIGGPPLDDVAGIGLGHEASVLVVRGGRQVVDLDDATFQLACGAVALHPGRLYRSGGSEGEENGGGTEHCWL